MPDKTVYIADPNVLGAAVIAGAIAYNGLSDASLDVVKSAWQIQMQFIAYLNDGGDVKDFERNRKLAKDKADKDARVAAEDARLEAERVAKARAEMNAKAPVA